MEHMTQCSWKGCTSAAHPNPADTENGPKPSDLDPVYCAYHTEELWLIECLDPQCIAYHCPNVRQHHLTGTPGCIIPNNTV